MSLLKKQSKASMSDPKWTADQPTEFESYPASWEFLTMGVWEEDGSRRETGTVLLFADNGGLKLMLNDRDGAKVSFAVVDSAEGILGTLEALLLSAATDWRPAKKGFSKGDRKG